MEPLPVKPRPRPVRKPRPDGSGYLAEPNKSGEIIRWRGAAHSDKIAMKKWYRRKEANEDPAEPESIKFKKVRVARERRSFTISQHNHKAARTERSAKEGKLKKPGAVNSIVGNIYAPFVLKLGRIPNTGYTGAELRAIRREKGCGRPVC